MDELLAWIVPLGTVLAALISARASKVSAHAARRSNTVALTSLQANRVMAENDWRIRMMDERMKVWRAFDDLMIHYLIHGISNRELIVVAHKEFQRAPFLFPPDVDRYLNKLTSRLLKQIHMQEQERITNAIDDDKAASRRARRAKNLFVWLVNQQRDGKKIFQKHMKLID